MRKLTSNVIPIHDVTKFRPGMIVSTAAGNRVWRLVRPTRDQPEWVANTHDVQWDAVLLFDAACENVTPQHDLVNVKNTILFDALRLALLWNQLDILSRELDGWAKGEHDDETGFPPSA